MPSDIEYVNRLLETKSNRPEIQAIQRHILALRSAAVTKGVGKQLPDRKNLIIRRTNQRGKNAVWVGCVRIETLVSGSTVQLEISAPEFVNIVREEVINDHVGAERVSS